MSSRDQDKPELRVPGWFVATFAGLQASLVAAVELLPPGTAWTIAKILYAGVLAVGTSVAMMSAGRRR